MQTMVFTTATLDKSQGWHVCPTRLIHGVGTSICRDAPVRKVMTSDFVPATLQKRPTAATSPCILFFALVEPCI